MYHTIGNHCLAAGRSALLQRLGLPETGYYSVRLAEGWSLVVLDTTELSTHSRFPEVRFELLSLQPLVALSLLDKRRVPLQLSTCSGVERNSLCYPLQISMLCSGLARAAYCQGMARWQA